ncbi:MAG TPA: AmmeMemoRadiSam system protein A [Coriobacteriia bacterium]|nr:AmmeMemoRadiSam system protein A [Coriobacteriia bacterium]
MPDIFGVIAPHPPIIVAGVGGSRREPALVTIRALDSVRRAIETFEPDTLVLMSPHAPALADAIVIDDSSHLRGSLSDFGDSVAHVFAGDPALSQAIAEDLAASGTASLARSHDARLRAGWLDHGSLVPLSFIDPDHVNKLVVISLSYVPYPEHRSIGMAVRSAAERLGRRVVFVASGDLSHRLKRDSPAGFSERGSELDAKIVALVTAGTLQELSDIGPDLVEAGGECGLRSFIAMSGFCGPDPVPTAVMSYEGPWGVGYLVGIAGAAGLDAAQRAGVLESGTKAGSPGGEESDIVRLARATIEAYVTGGPLPKPVLKGNYPQRAGAFVSLHEGEGLRGCIGTIAPTRATLADEVIGNAIAAATQDPRFDPVSESELDLLDVKVDVLHAPEPARLEDLDPSTYGVIVTNGHRRGLLLPDLEGIDDVETQVRIARSKAGIAPEEPVEYERFKVDRYT